MRVMRLAVAARPENCAAWARTGPATAPQRVAAASPVRNTPLTRPSAAAGITRWMAVCGITSDIEPNMPTPIAAGWPAAGGGEVKRRQVVGARAVLACGPD